MLIQNHLENLWNIYYKQYFLTIYGRCSGLALSIHPKPLLVQQCPENFKLHFSDSFAAGSLE